MILAKFYLDYMYKEPFLLYLLSSKFAKNISKEFEFYNVRFVKDEKAKILSVYLEYPKFNPYWFVDFSKYIEKELINNLLYKNEWEELISRLKIQVMKDLAEYKYNCDNFSLYKEDCLKLMFKYNLREYQAYDLLRLFRKMYYTNEYMAGLILSEPRTGKSRIAISYALAEFPNNSMYLIICPKMAFQGWVNELETMSDYIGEKFNINIIETTSSINNAIYSERYVFNIISYDLFKRLTKVQIKNLIQYKVYNKLVLIADELHRLRNFKTQQSEALFKFKEFLLNNYDKNKFAILGLTGTPAVKDSYDVFGMLSFINFTHIGFKPYYKDFNQFKEYFYNCEDTSFGKIAKSLKRQDELNYIIGINAIQTKQRDLDLFKDYVKKYHKIELEMLPEQKEAYDNVDKYMEYENIDCKNNLVKYLRLQQICNDPSVLLPAFGPIAPKLKFIIKFIQINDMKSLVISKSVETLNHLAKLLDKENITYGYINGSKKYNERQNEIDLFKTNEGKVMLLQLDTCKESLTLPEAECTIFIDRSFTQGFNEQAEARMTPINGLPTTKYVFDLVMKNTIEERIYNLLVQRKKNIKDVNELFKN